MNTPSEDPFEDARKLYLDSPSQKTADALVSAITTTEEAYDVYTNLRDCDQEYFSKEEILDRGLDLMTELDDLAWFFEGVDEVSKKALEKILSLCTCKADAEAVLTYLCSEDDVRLEFKEFFDMIFNRADELPDTDTEDETETE